MVMCHAARPHLRSEGAGVYFGEGKQHAFVTFRRNIAEQSSEDRPPLVENTDNIF